MVKDITLIRRSKCDTARSSDDINIEIGKDSHQNSVSTPRTEASTPESGEYTTFSICNSDRKKHNGNSPNDDTYMEPRLQRHLSQTDDHIQLLDRNGDLNEVVGSQSMLSQELIDHQHDENEDLNLPEGSLSTSSIGIAKRIGLLTQSQEELTHNQEEEESTQSKEPFSGLDLLTQAGSKEADKIPSFSTALNSKNSSIVNENDHDKDKDKNLSKISDGTTLRENEGFGSLLDAVAKITEQEASQHLSMNWRPAPKLTAPNTTQSRKPTKKRKISRSLPTTKNVSAPKQRKSEVQKKKEMLRRERIEQENDKAQAIAKKAAMIAERTITDPVIAKKLLLSMALARENPRTVPQSLPGKGHVVQEGFFWVSQGKIASNEIHLEE